MKNYRFLFFAAMLVPCLRLEADDGCIQPYAENPRYWQYKGQPVLLLGGSDDDNLFQWTGKKLTDHLDLLKSVGGNYVRNTMSDRDEGGEWGPAPKGVEMAYAFKKTGGRYDLSQWNDEYWRRFDDFLRETRRRRIFVQVELWDAFDFADLGTPGNIKTPLPPTWAPHPWNPRNNINYTEAETGVPEIWKEVHWRYNPLLMAVPKLNGDNKKITYTLPSGATRTMPKLKDASEVLGFQQRFIRKILEVGLKYDHVLYVVMNESSLPFDVGEYWAAFARREAAKVGRTIHVTDMRGRIVRDAPYVIDRDELFSYIDVSQNAHYGGQQHWDNLMSFRDKLANAPRPMNNVKMYVQGYQEWIDAQQSPDLATELNRREGPAKLWRSIFAGCASGRFHRPPVIYGLGLDETAQRHIKNLRAVTDEVVVYRCEPRNELLSDREPDEAYCLAEPGRKYAVYFPNGGSVQLDCSDVQGSLAMKWLDIAHSHWTEPQTIEAVQRLRLTAPGKGHWALVVKSSAE